MPGRWVVVVPVKDAAAGKTRLSGALDDGSRTALARAMALDTVAAAVSCPAVGVVVVVTADMVVARDASDDGRTLRTETGIGKGVGNGVGVGVGTTVRVVPEPPHTGARSGLDAAAAAGVAAARALVPAASVGVLLGDLPALRPDDLAAALAAAEAHPRCLVADVAGTGTTLLTVADGARFDSRFGAGSAAAHVALGYVLLDVAEASTLRHDVDLPADLEVLRELRPGPRTTRVLGHLGAGGDGGLAEAEQQP